MTEHWTRRQFLQRTSLAALAPYAARLARGITLAPPDQHLYEDPPDIEAFGKLIQVSNYFDGRQEIKSTPDSEIGRMTFQKREELPGNLVRYEFASRYPQRPHIVITEKGGNAQFVRQTLLNERGSPIAFMPSGYFYTVPIRNNYSPAPEFYNSYSSPPGSLHRSVAIGTEVSTRSGFAQVTEKDRPGRIDIDVYERHYFMPMTMEAYYRKWGRLGDYQKPRTALITVDGTCSDPRSQSFKAYEDLYDNYDRVEHLTHSDYSLNHTIQDLFRMSEVIRDKVEELKSKGIDSIDFLTYSLGSVVTWINLIREVAAPSGSQRDGTIRSFVSLAGPIGGVEDEARFSYGLSYMFGNTLLLGNETTNLLTFWGSSEDRRRENENYARTLRERGVRQMFGHNEDDCFTTTPFTTISGNSQVISMGRGENGIPDCDSIFLVPILPGNRIENIGHNQVLDDPRMVSNVTYFLTA